MKLVVDIFFHSINLLLVWAHLPNYSRIQAHSYLISSVNSPNHSKSIQTIPNSNSFQIIPLHFKSHVPHFPLKALRAPRLDCRNRFERCEVALLAATFPEAKAQAYHVMPKGAARASESDDEECSHQLAMVTWGARHRIRWS